MFKGDFITVPEFAYLTPLNVFHREGEKVEYSHPEELKNLHITFRKIFKIENKPGRVFASVSADDYYKLYINGTFAGQGPSP
jgi:alpha-L-rhamnosidase